MIRDRVVTEATFANVFIIDKNNNLITHPADNNILCGITRNRLIEIAKKINIKVIEKKFNLLEMMQAKELFLSSSSSIIRPVFNVDGKEISYNKNGDKLKYTRILADAYQKFIDG
jgi:D-alanine transaminase